ncbi:MAG: hypothetical protein JXR58_12380 [Bacteroidales bacterium]|nr:hypothetical protein [Bacteroidales bacterium]
METKDFSKAKQKWNEIKNRNFDKQLSLFLFKQILNKENLKTTVKLAAFEAFLAKENSEERKVLSEKYANAYKLAKNEDEFEGLKVGEIDQTYKQWYEKNKIKDGLYYDLRTWYIDNYFIKLEDFMNFYGENESKKRKCKYCGISEKDIEKLLAAGKLNTKRLATRGKFMEIDRKKPNDEYTLDNMVLSCYWCNNAKSDEFTYKEFKKIGDEIQKVFKNRLKSKSK